MIELSKYEKELVRLCKGKHRFSKGLTRIELFGKYYEKHYAMTTKNYPEWKHVIFRKLFNTFMKIRDWNGSPHEDILSIYDAAFGKRLSRDQEEPIERAMAELYGQIQCTTVIEKNKKRYELY